MSLLTVRIYVPSVQVSTFILAEMALYSLKTRTPSYD